MKPPRRIIPPVISKESFNLVRPRTAGRVKWKWWRSRRFGLSQRWTSALLWVHHRVTADSACLTQPLRRRRNAGLRPFRYKIEISTDGKLYSRVLHKTNNSVSSHTELDEIPRRDAGMLPHGDGLAAHGRLAFGYRRVYGLWKTPPSRNAAGQLARVERRSWIG